MIPLRHTAPSMDEEKSILLSLLYFDIFHYPLTESEIIEFSPQPLKGNWQSALITLIERQIIYSIDGFYLLHNDPGLVERRIAGNHLANRKMNAAKIFSRIVSMFPFVRAVMLSGSISKGYMDEKSDIDYFIITESKRLWIVRGAMATFRRVFLFNSHKYLCTNYFIDSEHLEVSEKNIFAAIEASTLKPMYGKKYISDFQAANEWCGDYLPNHKFENRLEAESGNFFKKVCEKILPVRLLDQLDHRFMKKSISRWKNNYAHLMNEHDFSIAFQSDVYVSRSHPGFYQKKVLSSYNTKIHDFELLHGISLEI
jgi:Nucleotidyltransferase domain